MNYLADAIPGYPPDWFFFSAIAFMVGFAVLATVLAIGDFRRQSRNRRH